jgi:pseudouridine synthase
LAQAGVASRRRAEQLIRDGAVRVNDAVVQTLGSQVDPVADRVEIDGRRVRPEAPGYRLVLKPRACLSTLTKPTGENAGRATLARYLGGLEPGWQLVAPLDFPSEGVILLTTDGELAERMSKSGGRVLMTYHIKYQGLVGDAEVARLLRGWKADRHPVRPKSVQPLATTGKNTWVEMVVAEARPRALKAGGDVIRRAVLKISRVKMGGISFEGLAMGGWRDLTRAEVASLRRAAGVDREAQ